MVRQTVPATWGSSRKGPVKYDALESVTVSTVRRRASISTSRAKCLKTGQWHFSDSLFKIVTNGGERHLHVTQSPETYIYIKVIHTKIGVT